MNVPKNKCLKMGALRTQIVLKPNPLPAHLKSPVPVWGD